LSWTRRRTHDGEHHELHILVVTQQSDGNRAVANEISEAGIAASRDAAFRKLAERNLEASYRLACAILGNPTEAQDATHDAFVQAWRQWSTLRDPARFEHWFDRILVNTCRNRVKRASRWRTQDLSDDLVAAKGDPFGQAADRNVLGAAIASLSPDHQLVVGLRFYRDLPVNEIARQLGIRPGTVHSRLHYAMKRLHAALDAADAEEALR
jgi:RNA polymerase sigma-70 factor (ECF subfamily)